MYCILHLYEPQILLAARLQAKLLSFPVLHLKLTALDNTAFKILLQYIIFQFVWEELFISLAYKKGSYLSWIFCLWKYRSAQYISIYMHKLHKQWKWRGGNSWILGKSSGEYKLFDETFTFLHYCINLRCQLCFSLALHREKVNRNGAVI